MTYLQYVNQLANDFLHKKANTQKIYETLLQSGGYLDRSKTAIYLKHVYDCHALADLAKLVTKDILAGSVSPFDEVD